MVGINWISSMTTLLCTRRILLKMVWKLTVSLQPVCRQNYRRNISLRMCENSWHSRCKEEVASLSEYPTCKMLPRRHKMAWICFIYRICTVLCQHNLWMCLKAAVAWPHSKSSNKINVYCAWTFFAHETLFRQYNLIPAIEMLFFVSL